MAKTSKVAMKKQGSPTMKAKTSSKLIKQSLVTTRKKVVVPAGLGKIRIGVIWGKDFDPIKVGTQDRNYPEHAKMKKNTGAHASGWGGQFHADVSTGLKIARLHPDIFEVDLMKMEDATEARLAKNHLTFSFWGDVSIGLIGGRPDLAKRMAKIQQKAEQMHHFPAWDYYEWVLHKNRYMKQCIKQGIPMIPTIFVDNGFDANVVLKQIRARGWQKFLIKPGYMTCFGEGVLHGKTQDLVDDITPFLNYQRDNSRHKEFLVQPYMLKPNGDVFDEIRNYFIDGEWHYSVFTHGTDEDTVYEQPVGALKDACKQLAMRAAAEAQKASTWEGKQINTLLNRIDIGVIPDKSTKLGYKLFVNEIEPQMTTWLGRYCPFDIAEKMGHACVKKARQAIKVSLARKTKMPNADNVKKLLEMLDERLGPLEA